MVYCKVGGIRSDARGVERIYIKKKIDEMIRLVYVVLMDRGRPGRLHSLGRVESVCDSTDTNGGMSFIYYIRLRNAKLKRALYGIMDARTMVKRERGVGEIRLQ